MKRLLALGVLLLSAAAHATIPLFTGPAGTNPIEAPVILDDMNNLINQINDAIGSGGSAAPAATLMSALTGAACNGVTNDTAAVLAFDAAGGGYVPRSTTIPSATHPCVTTTPRPTFNGLFFGLGRISDVNGNLLGAVYSNTKTPPTLLGNYNAAAEGTAFNYDSAKSILSIDANLTGTAVGVPATNYYIAREVSPIYGMLRSTVGNNGTVPGNIHRTGINANLWELKQTGQGDMTAFFMTGLVNSACSATISLACPGVTALSSDIQAATDFAWLENIGDIDSRDKGFQASLWTLVGNLFRDNAVGDRNTGANGVRIHSVGAKPVDSFFSGSGDTSYGLDLTSASFPDNILANITLAAAGAGYTVGDLLTMSGGTFDQQTVVQVLTTSAGAILTFGLDRSGKYSVNPTALNTPTGGTGSGAQFNLVYSPGAAIAIPFNSWIYLNASSDSTAFGTSFTSTNKAGTTRMGYNTATSPLDRVQFLINNALGWEASATQMTVNKALQIGTQTQLVMTPGQIGMTVIPVPTTSPGNLGATLTWVCGTSAGTAKLIATAGLASAGTTIINNVGSGVLGC